MYAYFLRPWIDRKASWEHLWILLWNLHTYITYMHIYVLTRNLNSAWAMTNHGTVHDWSRFWMSDTQTYMYLSYGRRVIIWLSFDSHLTFVWLISDQESCIDCMVYPDKVRPRPNEYIYLLIDVSQLRTDWLDTCTCNLIQVRIRLGFSIQPNPTQPNPPGFTGSRVHVGLGWVDFTSNPSWLVLKPGQVLSIKAWRHRG